MQFESQGYASEVSIEHLMASVKMIAQRERVAGTADEVQSFLFMHRVVWGIGRILVPLNYICGNAFENDPAVAQPPMPAPSSIGMLRRGAEDVRKEVQVDLVRHRNYVQHSLGRALEVLGA